MAPHAAADPNDPAYQVLAFSKTAGFRHDSIDEGLTALRELGSGNNFTVTATEDAGAFTAGNLAQYEAVVFLNTTGDVLNAAQQSAFEGYIRGGGGYVGVHAASDTEYDWPWYGGLAGAYFASHPAIQTATVNVEDRAHPATSHLPATWQRSDEWYNFRVNPRSGVRVLLSLNESTYSGGSMNGDHPISWCRNYDGGRSFYTGLGHTAASYTDAAYRNHLLGGLRWAAGVAGGNCGAGSGGTQGHITGYGGKCLDVQGGNTADGTRIQLWSCGATNPNQMFTVPGDGTVRAFGKCVTGTGTTAGSPVLLYGCDGGADQRWTAQSDGTLRSAVGTNLCMDASGPSTADGTRIHLWGCHGRANQLWALPT
ncbi:ThuA domain-containing protein [Streptomyces sp. 184]